jgi:DNA-binding CsgD family transcriptional regulator
MADGRQSGRRAFQQQAWGQAYAELSAADRDHPLDVDDLERLAVSAYLVGEIGDSAAVTARGFHECLHRGDVPRAARCAFWLALGLLLGGEMAPAQGWLSRAQRLLDDGDHDCVERGLLRVPVVLGHLMAGDSERALAESSEVLSIGEQFDDADVATLGRLGRGQALVIGGNRVEGAAELDDAMVAVTAGEVSPAVAGIVYCAVIDTCHRMFDLRRATEWTEALSRWCESQPELVAYRGQCLVHRAEILQLNGAWSDAMDEAQRAFAQLSRPPGHPAAGDALYRVAELRRLRGEFERAEHAYREASEFGRDPQPGLARLRLAQGQLAAAASAIRRAVDEAPDGVSRSQLLAAQVEIALAGSDVDTARKAADELAEFAASFGAPILLAVSAHATGLVLLADGDARSALSLLRQAWVTWRDLESPYEAACVRVAVRKACLMLGDDDGASLELAAARRAFGALGAVADLTALEQDVASAGPDAAGGLTGREREVLRLVASGMTNRAIASELVISEKTVARHVANIFTKLGLSSRSAATAYAYDHGLVVRAYTK